LQRQGYYASTCGFDQIDNLTYTYTPNTNRIASIADNAPLSQRSQGFNPGSGGVGYTYDANGNLKSDSYKGISTIFYNHLNLPSLINFTSGNSIEYKYDAGGNKLRKTVKVGAVVQYEQYYVGGVEYRKTGTGNTRIEAIYHSEGRYANIDLDIDDSPNWRKEYNIKDHLGNTRLSFADKNGNGVIDITNTPATNDILQENHYYPFGLSYEGPWLMNDATRDNKYQYNGKELNDDFGLNWYDYGARYYMPDIGRWGQIDPMAESMASWSPYSYTFNNPLKYTDPTGMAPFGDYFDWNGNYLGSDEEDDEKVYVADSKTNLDGATTFNNARDLGVTMSVFSAFASMIWNESSGNKTESYALANATMNFVDEGGSSQLETLEDVALYKNSFARGTSQKEYDNYIDAGGTGANSRNEVDAAINALMGSKNPEARANGHFKDYSNSSNGWDGIDLLYSKTSNAHRKYTWSEGSQSVLQGYKKQVNGGVDVDKWSYGSNAEITANMYIGKSLFYTVHTGRGEGKLSKKRIKTD